MALFEFTEGNHCFTPDRLRVPPHDHLTQSDLTGCRTGHSEGLRLRDGRREEQIAGLRIARWRTTDRGPRRTAAFPLPPLPSQVPTVPAWRGCSVLVALALRSHWISRDSSEFHRLWNSLSTAWISLLTPTKRAFRKQNVSTSQQRLFSEYIANRDPGVCRPLSCSPPNHAFVIRFFSIPAKSGSISSSNFQTTHYLEKRFESSLCACFPPETHSNLSLGTVSSRFF